MKRAVYHPERPAEVGLLGVTAGKLGFYQAVRVAVCSYPFLGHCVCDVDKSRGNV